MNVVENREAYLKCMNLDKLSLGESSFDMIDDSDPRAIHRSYNGNPPKRLLDALAKISKNLFLGKEILDKNVLSKHVNCGSVMSYFVDNGLIIIYSVFSFEKKIFSVFLGFYNTYTFRKKYGVDFEEIK